MLVNTKACRAKWWGQLAAGEVAVDQGWLEPAQRRSPPAAVALRSPCCTIAFCG